MSRTFRFATSCLKSVYGTFTGALALGKKYRMIKKLAARIATNVSQARRGGTVIFGLSGEGEEPGGVVGGSARRGGVGFGVAMPNVYPDAFGYCAFARTSATGHIAWLRRDLLES